MSEILGVPLSRLEDPILQAVQTYQELADNGLIFDAAKASRLELTPDKPNSARSESEIRVGSERIGTLYTIAFKPGDGSGSEADYRLANLKVERGYPRKPLIVPRNKTGVHAEAQFAIVRHGIEDVHAEPELFEGTFDLIGLKGGKIGKIGELGNRSKTVMPAVTFTVGFDNGRRFGDPHAVYSGVADFLQVCAFLAVNEQINAKYGQILDRLHPQLPYFKG